MSHIFQPKRQRRHTIHNQNVAKVTHSRAFFNTYSLLCLMTILTAFQRISSFQFIAGVGASFQTGKFNISQNFQDWSCSNACSPPSHCHLPRCTNIQFPEQFRGSGKVSLPMYNARNNFISGSIVKELRIEKLFLVLTISAWSNLPFTYIT